MHEQSLSLWALAQVVCPHKSAAYSRWLRVTSEGDNLPLGSMERIKSKLKSRQSGVVSVVQLNAAYAERAAVINGNAFHLIATVLPARLRAVITANKYDIKGRRSTDGRLVLVTAEQIAAVNFDIPNNRLLGADCNYNEITATPRIGKKGRPVGAGTFNDAPHHERMREMILLGKAKSPHDAAVKIADSVTGASFDSTVRRLGRSYKVWEKQGFPLRA